MKLIFRLIKTPPENYYLLFDHPDHFAIRNKINKFVGSPIVAINGSGCGINLKIINLDLWSDYISAHVIQIDEDYFEIKLPKRKIKRKPRPLDF